MKTSKQFKWTALFKGWWILMQLIFVEMYSSTQASLDTAWLANYLAKQSRQTRLTEIIHNTKKPEQLNLTKPN